MAMLPPDAPEEQAEPKMDAENAKENAKEAPKDPGDPNTLQRGLLSIGKSLNEIESSLKDAGAPQEVIAKLGEAAQAYMDFLDMMQGNATKQASGPAPAESGGMKGAMPADNMAAGRKGARPMMG